MRRRERVATSFSQGDRWKRLISRYMKAMPPKDRRPGSDMHSMLCMSFAETHAINAKMGEAARPRQCATSRVHRVLAGRFLVRIDVVIFELPMKFADAISA